MAKVNVGDGRRPAVGDRAPNFTLPAQAGEVVSLQDFLDKRCVVLYFYPKDNTPGCTTESCAFRDSYTVLQDLGAEVLGVSSDPISAHQDFATSYQLPFKLLSDEGGQVRKLYGVPATLGILPGRVTYVIDQQGVIRHIFNSQFNFKGHIEAAIETLKQLQTV